MRLASETLDAVADRGYYEGDEIKSCEEAGITVTLPKLQTSSAKAEGRFGKQDTSSMLQPRMSIVVPPAHCAFSAQLLQALVQ
jgi:hypothetical protein